MKQFVCLLAALITCSAFAQQAQPYVVYDQIMLTPNPEKIAEFQKVLAEHNQKFHPEGAYDVGVFQIMTGPNSGKFIWNLGPVTWADMDKRPMDKAHNEHWATAVAATLTTDSWATYWRHHPEFTNMSQDFELNMLRVNFYDIKRGMDSWEKVEKIMERFTKLYREHYPDDVFATYSNVMASTGEGKDMAIVGFVDNFAAMGDENPDVPEKYNAMYGEGSFEKDITTWLEVMVGESSELWMFLPDLSTSPKQVTVSQN